MTEQEKLRRRSMEKRAHAMAGSGRHLDYLTIERALLDEGFTDAREWLGRDAVRAAIQVLCDTARRRQLGAGRTPGWRGRQPITTGNEMLPDRSRPSN